MAELARLYKALMSRRFELTCHKIKLVLAPGYTSECFIGSGIIRAAPHAGFEVRMVGKATRTTLLDLWPHGRTQNTRGAPPEWYQVRALDAAGVEWVGGWVRPRILRGFPEALSGAHVELSCMVAGILTHDTDAALGTRSAGEGELHEFIVPSAGRLWWSGWTRSTTVGPHGESEQGSASYHSADIDGMHIILEDGPDEDAVTAHITPVDEAAALPPFADLLVLQGLQVLTARMLHFGVQYRRGASGSCLWLFGAPQWPTQPSLPPPYRLTGHPFEPDHYWELFECIVAWLKGQPISPRLHPSIETLLLIIDASTRSFEAFSLALAVGVESILDCSMSAMETTEEMISPAELRALKDHIAAYTGSARPRQRVLGFVGRLGEWGTADRLRKLRAKGVIDEMDEEAWRRLRNPVAHGQRRGTHIQRDPESQRVLAMFYSILLRETGYAGPINPYA